MAAIAQIVTTSLKGAFDTSCQYSGLLGGSVKVDYPDCHGAARGRASECSLLPTMFATTALALTTGTAATITIGFLEGALGQLGPRDRRGGGGRARSASHRPIEFWSSRQGSSHRRAPAPEHRLARFAVWDSPCPRRNRTHNSRRALASTKRRTRCTCRNTGTPSSGSPRRRGAGKLDR
jgi:hypothetical protein